MYQLINSVVETSELSHCLYLGIYIHIASLPLQCTATTPQHQPTWDQHIPRTHQTVIQSIHII